MTHSMNTDQALSGLNILITGAGFDIGKALAIRCASQGAHVVLMDKDGRALDAVYDTIISAKSVEPTILQLDSAELLGATAEMIRNQIITDHGKLDGLVHTANVSFPLTPVNMVDDEGVNKAFNLLHTMPHRITRELFPVLQAAEHPSVIFTSHFSATSHRPFWGYHAGAFAALEALSRQWASDTRNIGFSVNSIDPGAVKTAVRKKHYPAEDMDLLRLPDDDEIMSLYLNLLGARGKARSGEHFVVPDFA